MRQLQIERFLNISARKDKEKYAQEVWDLLQFSYKSIGGIKGSGFMSPQDMIENIPFWKLVRKNGKIVAAQLYKDKGGRKAVASGTDGSPEGKQAFELLQRDDYLQERSYSELSSNALRFVIDRWKRSERTKDIDIRKYMIPPQRAEQILKEKLHYPVPTDDPEVQSFPEFKEFFYQREIGGEMITKLMLGSAGKTLPVQ